MAGRDNPYDMQIKLLMIGDSGNGNLSLSLSLSLTLFLSFSDPHSVQVSERHVYCFAMPMILSPRRSSPPLGLISRLKILPSMGRESSSRFLYLSHLSFHWQDLGYSWTREI
jgi:hypothetical protein